MNGLKEYIEAIYLVAASVIHVTAKWNVCREIDKEQVWMNCKVRSGYSSVSCECYDNTKFIK